VGIERYCFLISGRVQGVGYRYATHNYASQLNLVGWVKNRQDGKVEVVAEGDKAILEQLLAWLKQGPRFANVSNVKVTPLPAIGEFIDFSIR